MKKQKKHNLLLILVAGLLIVGVVFLIAKRLSESSSPLNLPKETLKSNATPASQETLEGKFCGGIAGILCPEGFECIFEESYPDAAGKCQKI